MDADRWALTRQAIEAGFEAGAEEGCDFSVLGMLAAYPEHELKQLRPGVYYGGGDAEAAERLLAEYHEFCRQLKSEAEDDEDLTRGYSLLRELARSDDTMVEIAPSVWQVQKTDTVREG